MDSPDFVKSTRGKDHLIHDGYRFIIDKEAQAKTTWHCSNRRRQKCKARVHTVGGEVTKYFNVHNHPPDAAKLAAKRVEMEIKMKALESNSSPQVIIATVSQGLSRSVQAQLPAIRVMKRNVQRVRKRVRHPQVVPNSLTTLEFPPGFTTTATGANFLLFDSGPGNDRIVVFGTADNLSLMSRSPDLFADGTFKTSPNLFLQVYTIHAVVHNNILPLIYALLPNKTTQTYQKLFESLHTLEPRLNPARIMTDFELAAKNAFRAVFPQTQQHGCLFHFGQCIWRNLQRHGGLQERYKNDPEFQLKIKCLNALAFCPVESVIPYFEELVRDPVYAESPAITEFMDYFETAWIGQQRRNHRREPLVPIAEWNVYGRVLDNVAKTNNKIEGWHRAFQGMLECYHPTIWRFVDALKKQQSNNELRVTQCLAGENPDPQRRVYRDSAERIKKIVEDFENRTPLEFLAGIAHNLNLNV